VTTIQVVSGLCRSGNTVLMQHRNSQGLRPSMWELAGGKVEDGETHAAALGREWDEELGVDVEVGEYIASCMFDLEITLAIHLYEVRVIAPEPVPTGSAVKWVHPGHAEKYMPCTPAFYMHYPYIVRWMASR
jgi:(d)CTP diphosphatase